VAAGVVVGAADVPEAAVAVVDATAAVAADATRA
jgi:hypothetical protein